MVSQGIDNMRVDKMATKFLLANLRTLDPHTYPFARTFCNAQMLLEGSFVFMCVCFCHCCFCHNKT